MKKCDFCHLPVTYDDLTEMIIKAKNEHGKIIGKKILRGHEKCIWNQFKIKGDKHEEN
jgi:hypothetical protein